MKTWKLNHGQRGVFLTICNTNTILNVLIRQEPKHLIQKFKIFFGKNKIICNEIVYDK